MSETENPDVTVSVDLGTTYTGVAWRAGRRPIQVINEWPGSGDRGQRKVPSTLVYDVDDDNNPTSWGFLCDDDYDGGRRRCSLFKLYLDGDAAEAAAQNQDLANAPMSVAEARRCTAHYLHRVYKHVKETIEQQMGLRRGPSGGWDHLTVLFLFSVPTTWTRMRSTKIFEEIIRAAGFGTGGPRHEARVDLTEAEAAAVTTLKTGAVHFAPGSLFLTIDAGGGTTDLALMRVLSTNAALPQMEQVAAVRGDGIGSTLIDDAFIRLVSKRLAARPDVERTLPADVAVRMAKSHHFINLKHKFGESVHMWSVWKIPMEGVSHDFSNQDLGIERGRFLVTREQVQSLFDTQVDGIKRQIKLQLDCLSGVERRDEVEFVILSGGLGSSAYVRDRIQQHLISFPYPNAPRAEVIPCQDPQLVVVRGLLLDRQKRPETGLVSVLATRVARASYGVVVQVPYTRASHPHEEFVRDAFNQRWAINQIQWLIRKGESINTKNPLIKTFEIRLAEEDMTRSWDADIVISHNDKWSLPHSMKQGGVQRLCQIRSNLDGVKQHQLVLKKKHSLLTRRSSRYYICKLDVHIIVAPADIRFELWLGNERFSGNHQPVSVSWDDAGLEAGDEYE